MDVTHDARRSSLPAAVTSHPGPPCCPAAQLPPELLRLIFAHLPHLRAVVRVSGVSRAWWAAAQEQGAAEACRQRRELRLANLLRSAPDLGAAKAALAATFPLQRPAPLWLDLSAAPSAYPWGAQFVRHVARRHPDLPRLSLAEQWLSHMLNAPDPVACLLYPTALRRLDVGGAGLPPEALALLPLQGLRELRVKHLGSYRLHFMHPGFSPPPGGDIEVSLCSTSLTSLHLRGATTLVLGCLDLPAIRELKLSNVGVRRVHIGPHLTALDLQGQPFSGGSPAILQALRLADLRLAGVPSTEEVLGALPLAHLRRLHLFGSSIDNGLPQTALRLPEVRHLVVTRGNISWHDDVWPPLRNMDEKMAPVALPRSLLSAPQATEIHLANFQLPMPWVKGLITSNCRSLTLCNCDLTVASLQKLDLGQFRRLDLSHNRLGPHAGCLDFRGVEWLALRDCHLGRPDAGMRLGAKQYLALDANEWTEEAVGLLDLEKVRRLCSGPQKWPVLPHYFVSEHAFPQLLYALKLSQRPAWLRAHWAQDMYKATRPALRIRVSRGVDELPPYLHAHWAQHTAVRPAQQTRGCSGDDERRIACTALRLWDGEAHFDRDAWGYALVHAAVRESALPMHMLPDFCLTHPQAAVMTPAHDPATLLWMAEAVSDCCGSAALTACVAERWDYEVKSLRGGPERGRLWQHTVSLSLLDLTVVGHHDAALVQLADWLACRAVSQREQTYRPVLQTALRFAEVLGTATARSHLSATLQRLF